MRQYYEGQPEVEFSIIIIEIYAVQDVDNIVQSTVGVVCRSDVTDGVWTGSVS